LPLPFTFLLSMLLSSRTQSHFYKTGVATG
jgi:hypothetical protein